MPKRGNPFRELLAHDLIALFGAYALRNFHKEGRTSSPENVQVHRDWNPSHENYDANIAIIRFKDDAITFSPKVQPICLWNMTTDPTETFGQINRWEQFGSLMVPFINKVPIHTNEFCISKSEDLVDVASNRTFCGKKGPSYCASNKSGGLTIKVGSTFYFRGIISSDLHGKIGCDASNYSIFTDVLKFKPWINQILKEDGEIFYLRCKIQSFSDSGLFHGSKDWKVCRIYDQKIDEEGFSVAGDPNQSIQIFYINDNKEVKFLPANIAVSFPGLITYVVKNCSISTINVKHFKGLNTLEHLDLERNDIETIDGDSFKDLTKLNDLILSANKIHLIDSNLFQSLKILTILIINENPLVFLDEKIFVNLKNLKNILLNANRLSVIPKNLFINNSKLETIGLQMNIIALINSTMFDHLNNLRYVDLQFNFCVFKCCLSIFMRDCCACLGFVISEFCSGWTVVAYLTDVRQGLSDSCMPVINDQLTKTIIKLRVGQPDMISCSSTST